MLETPCSEQLAVSLPSALGSILVVVLVRYLLKQPHILKHRSA